MTAFPAKKTIAGPDRFSNKPALTTESLVDAIKADPAFRRNLARHFGLPEERVTGFVQEALVPLVLSKEAQVMNYGVTKAGKIYGKKTTLKKGTRVWATRDQKPILKWDCSNPLLAKLPVLREKALPTAVSTTRSVGIQSVGAEELPPPILVAVSAEQLTLESPMEPAVPAMLLTEPLPSPVPTRVSSSTRLGLPLLALAGVAAVTIKSSPPSNAIPEPGTLALCVLGVLGGTVLRRCRSL